MIKNEIKKTRKRTINFFEKISKTFFSQKNVHLRYVGDKHLMRGATSGKLIGIEDGGQKYNVLVDGYKTPLTFSSSFWRIDRKSLQELFPRKKRSPNRNKNVAAIETRVSAHVPMKVVHRKAA